ncbi:major capsid protein [Shumkonia mesophila]|uniref:major capsid protein n=1 Tax=Shumkonia mesophila TaxID=2838854 RepID=UPI002934D26A|nr:major capsid protein [Shumkonia mesophila]
MPTIDIFRNNAFSCVSLVDAVERVPYAPNFLGSIPNLFVDRPVRTLTVAVEERNGVLGVIQTTPRGAPLPQRTNEKREIRDFRTVRIAEGDRIMASEIQDIRAFGSETELMQVMDEVTRRYAGPTGIKARIELTWEYHRLGAVQGIVYDADNSEIIDWFDAFGITQDNEIDFDLDNNNPASGAVRKVCTQVVRQTLAGLKMGSVMPQAIPVMGLAGNAFWDDLTAHKEVRETYLNQQEASEMRKGAAYETVSYGGITFVNYHSSDDGKVGIHTDKCKFFPVVPGLFQRALSPGESFEFVNTLGREIYPYLVPDKDRNMWVDVEGYSYPLFICTRPKALQRAKRT